MVKLNLGSADRHFEGYVSVDRYPPADVVTDLSTDNWPWETSSVDAIIAYDIIEHLPDRINTMNEMWRILKNGGIADIEVPNAAHGAAFAQDPTHVSMWVKNSFQYYQHGSFAVQRLADSYGIRARFEIVSLSDVLCPDMFEEVWKIKAVLKAVK